MEYRATSREQKWPIGRNINVLSSITPENASKVLPYSEPQGRNQDISFTASELLFHS